MKILFQAIQIIDKGNAYHNQVVDLMVENGTITQIGINLDAQDAIIYNVPGLSVSLGWIDMRVALRDPGHEAEEDLTTLKEVAARGGFTAVGLLPNTQPTVDTKDTLSYIKRSSGVVDLLPYAAVTKKCAGEDFSDMIDLHHAGAAAFTDGEHPLYNSDIFLKSIQYLKPLDALLINKPEDYHLALFGQMHEGVESTLLGFKGIPALAEEMMIMRDLNLLEYALSNTSTPLTGNSVLHFSLISSKGSVELIRQAKAKGLPVSCDVAAHQLAFEDTALYTFDTNLKVTPPFRTREDIEALQQGLADGTIDVIVSDHTPHAPESKDREFDLAAFGITGLETAFAVGNMHAGLSVEQLVDKLTYQPRQILRMPVSQIAVGTVANLTFFAPTQEWDFTKTYSTAHNTPFLGEKLVGKVWGILNNGTLQWFA